jgi:hypothetical protein
MRCQRLHSFLPSQQFSFIREIIEPGNWILCFWSDVSEGPWGDCVSGPGISDCLWQYLFQINIITKITATETEEN